MGTLLFSSVSDADPATPPGTHILPTGSNPARIAGGQFDLGAVGTMALWAEAAEPAGNIITASVILGAMGSDSCGPSVTTAGGDAYHLLVRNNDIRLWLGSGGVFGSQITPTLTVTNAENEKISIRVNKSTGLIEALKNDAVVASWNNTTYSTGLLGAAMSRGGTLKSMTVEGSSTSGIVSINGDNTVVHGSAGNTIETSLLTVSTLSIGGIAVTPTEVDANNHTWDMPGFVDTEVYPAFGVVSAAVNTDEATKDVTLSLDPDYTATPMDTLSEADDCIAIVAASEGLTIVATDTLYNTTGLTIYDDSTISDADDGTHIVWHRAAATNVMTQINLIVSGGVIVTGNLTARALTARSLTSRSLTVRSL